MLIFKIVKANSYFYSFAVKTVAYDNVTETTKWLTLYDRQLIM